MVLHKKVVIALGGNAILQPGQKGTAEEQLENVQKAVNQIVPMVAAGYDIVLTHGNGPQVRSILIQHEAGRDKVPALPMDFCGSESQGFIGYMFCRLLRNALHSAWIEGKDPVCVVTQVEVSPDDPAFAHPTKPVGPFYTEEAAKARAAAMPQETWVEDAGRGWRRVVPSPEPIDIVEKNVISMLVNQGKLVIASGGGGIPVVRRGDGLHGIEAVIDKDLAGELLARSLGAQIFMMLTDVPKVALNYGTPDQTWIDDVYPEEMWAYAAAGHFKAGSMGPKVKAALRFVERGGEMAIIANLGSALDALEGRAGTRILNPVTQEAAKEKEGALPKILLGAS